MSQVAPQNINQIPQKTGISWCNYNTNTPTRGELVLSNVSRLFDNTKTPVLENISLTCKPGEFVVVVGPSGSGKSTLLNIASGMDFPTSGTVKLDGKTFSAPGPDRAMVFQDHGLFPWLTAEENIGFGLKMLGYSKSEQADRVAAALKMVHLTQSRTKLLHELSGGMKQRTAIARALAANPRILLMDEPFGALDAQTRAQMQTHLLEIWRNVDVTILFITHDLDEAILLADRILVLKANPGEVQEVIEVPVPRPRSLMQVNSPEFLATRRRLDELIHPKTDSKSTEVEKLPIIRLTQVGDDVE